MYIWNAQGSFEPFEDYQTSTNDRCGPNNGNTRCPPDKCCSANGWCGTSKNHCGGIRKKEFDGPKSRDCVVTVWGPTSKCSTTCGKGTQTHSRTMLVPKTYNGKECPPLTETITCTNSSGCPPEKEFMRCQGDNGIYRFENNKKRVFPNSDIASSWDPDWSTKADKYVIDCNGLEFGNPMATKGNYVPYGCYKQKYYFASAEGTDPILDGRFIKRNDPVRKCYDVANKKGKNFFIVRNGGECLIDDKIETNYQKLEKSTACTRDGKGGLNAYNLYKVE